jgi:hypothetical protein
MFLLGHRKNKTDLFKEMKCLVLSLFEEIYILLRDTRR